MTEATQTPSPGKPSSTHDHGPGHGNGSEVDHREQQLFQSLDRDGVGSIRRSEILGVIKRMGLQLEDARLQETLIALHRYVEDEPITYADFSNIVRPNILLVERVLQGHTVIPDFEDFCGDIGQIYTETRKNQTGKVADYIPQLGRVAPDQYGVALCTIDGQRYSVGDTKVDFSIQSTTKPINYCLALEEHGEDLVHKHVGREPSGRGFNDLTLDSHGRPHNPMINAGAIMCCSLVRPKLDLADRFDFVMDSWAALAGGQRPRFNNSVYLSERGTADRNFALGYFMRENKAFPEGTNLVETLEFYFQCCSIEMNAEIMSVVAATLANGGVCPTTGKQIFSLRTVQNCLSLMYSCGMYDFSGEFAFSIGLPAKSGVAGALMIVVPNVMGICTWAPRLDKHGNSVRGVEFCKRLVNRFNFHNYDNLTGLSQKKDPRRSQLRAKSDEVMSFIWAVSKGDITALQQYLARGADINEADYDGRAPLHLAAAEGHERVVEFLLNQGAELNPRDRWNGTPLEDAYRGNHRSVISLLEKRGAVR
jgi:glutaminase